MNIFEQYGIKEVADVTLYAIELDKYDEEVYIPILYFDTLKISTVEQTAEQTSARGGLGNPELIMWDYGKEITVTLEDALYSPASQSLMWGGKFGTKHGKIYGIWNPINFEKDSYGRKIYIEKQIATLAETEEYYIITDTNGKELFQKDSLDEDWIEFLCPCDGKKKWYRYYPANNGYKYLNWRFYETPMEDQLEGKEFLCPKGYPIYEKEDGAPLTGYDIEDVENLGMWVDKKRPEMAVLEADNYGDFNLKYYLYNIKIEEGIEKACISTESSTPPGECGCSGALGYIWENVGFKMTSLEGEQDLYYLENSNMRFTIPTNSSNKTVTIARSKLYDTVYDDETESWIKSNPEMEVQDYVELKVSSKKSYGYYVEDYLSKIDFYIKISYGDEEIGETKKYVKVKVGTFYIITDWNMGQEAPQEWIYPIEDGMNDVPYFDRMEKCKASQTFAIDVNTNTLLGNRRHLHKYDHCEMTVFIDPKTMKPYEANSTSFMRKNGTVLNGNLRIIKQHEIFYRWTRKKAPPYTTLGHEITIDAMHYPGTYRLVGETYARNRNTGKDERYQFELPLCKMVDNTSLTLQADGDPTTFTMELKCLRREDGTMMKLTQYLVDCNKNGGTNIIPQEAKITPPEIDPYYKPYETKIFKYFIVNPPNNSVYFINEDTENGIGFFKDGKPYITFDLDKNYPKLPDDKLFQVYGITDNEILNNLQYLLGQLELKDNEENLIDLNNSLLIVAAVKKTRNYSEENNKNDFIWIKPEEVLSVNVSEDGDITTILNEGAILNRYIKCGGEV